MCRLFGGGFVAAIVGAELFQQGGAQAAFEGAAGDVGLVVVRVGCGAFDLEAVMDVFAFALALDDFAVVFLVFGGDAFADAARVCRSGDVGFGVVVEVALDVLQVAALGGSVQFPLFVGVEDGAGGIEGVEHTVCDEVVGGFVVFACAEVDGRERGEVQGVAVEEVCHGGSLCCAVGW